MSNIPNRYKQLLVSVPKGTFYESQGQTVPYRSDPYNIRVMADAIASKIATLTLTVDAQDAAHAAAAYDSKQAAQGGG